MKKFYLLCPLLFFVTAFMPTVYALEPTSSWSATRSELRKDLTNKQATLRAEIKEQKEEFTASRQAEIRDSKNKMTEQRLLVINKYFTNMMQKIENALDRLTRIGEKIALRLSKLKAAGKNVSSLEAQLIVAQTTITETRSLIAATKEEFAAMTTSVTPKEVFFGIKKSVAKLAVNVKKIHKIYVEIILSMKGMSETTKPIVTDKPITSPTAELKISPTEIPENKVTPTGVISVTPTP